jgi:DNA-binding FadR family transcriptional regulator
MDFDWVGTVVNVAWQTNELQIARSLLEHWEASDSTNAQMARLRAAVESNAGAYALALEWCKTTIERNPQMREEMDGVAKTLKEKLREEADRLAPIPSK